MSAIGSPGTYTRDFVIDLPPGSVDENGDAIVPGVTALPVLAPRRESEPVGYYGFRALSFLLTTGCYATLTDGDLDLAYGASQTAIAGPLDDTARANMIGVRRMILLVLADRAAYRRACARDVVQADLTTPETTAPEQTTETRVTRYLRAILTMLAEPDDQNPEGGSREPRRPIVPTLPSGGTALPVKSDDIAF